MTDYYHFFGIKDKENRFLMRLVNPFAFDVLSAQIKLSELFATHGSCPASNDVTWSPWKAGKTIYQMWNVTPNKLGLIKSATPTLTLDGVPYLGYSIYLLSLANYTKVYSNLTGLKFPSYWKDLDGVAITGSLSDFVPADLGDLDMTNMAGIFIQNPDATLDFNTIKPWIEAGNILINARSWLINVPFSYGRKSASPGDYVRCAVDEVELEPIRLKTGSFTVTASDKVAYFYNESPPSGWTTRTLIEAVLGGVTYHHVQEFIHTASGGRLILLAGVYYGGYEYSTFMPGWWYPIIAFQYPMMKLAGVSAYYTE